MPLISQVKIKLINVNKIFYRLIGLIVCLSILLSHIRILRKKCKINFKRHFFKNLDRNWKLTKKMILMKTILNLWNSINKKRIIIRRKK